MPFAPPDYDGACLTAVLPAAFSAVGAPIEWCGGTGERAADVLGLEPARRIAIVLVDGLGEEQFAERLSFAPFLRRRARTTIESAFPSTTAVSLTALGTGLVPGRTAVAGYSLRDPASRRVFSLITWDGPSPEGWQREPTAFERGAGAGVAPIAVLPSKFANSGLTRAALRGAHVRAADGPDQIVDAAAAALREPGPGVVYVYWGEVDRIGHARGWQSHQWSEGLGEVDLIARQLAARAPKDAACYLTADHGMVDVATGPAWDVAQVPMLGADVEAIGGEPRCLQLYCAPGRAEEVARRWRSELGAAAEVRLQDDAEEWFGTMTPFARSVIGDVIVATTGQARVVDSRIHRREYRELAGQHGSLTAAERLVPWLRLA